MYNNEIKREIMKEVLFECGNQPEGTVATLSTKIIMILDKHFPENKFRLDGKLNLPDIKPFKNKHK